MNTIDSEIRNIIKYTVSSSYVSTIILNNDNVKLIMKYGNNVNDLKKDKDFLSKSIQTQNWILASMYPGARYINCVPNIPNAILDVVWDIISDFIFPGKKLAKIRKNITEYIKTAKKEYINYVESHEKKLHLHYPPACPLYGAGGSPAPAAGDEIRPLYR